MKPTLMILAAGMGSRYGGLKQIDQIGPSGEAIIDYSIYDAIRAGFKKIVFIIRKNIEKDFRDVFSEKLRGRIEMEFVFQELDMVPDGFRYPEKREKPWGTGHAVWVAAGTIKEPFAVINADDFYGPASYQLIADYLISESRAVDNKYCMIGYQVGNTLSEHGSVSRGICESTPDGFLTAVVERTEIDKEGDEIYYLDESGNRVVMKGDEMVSMNIWGFTPGIFNHLENSFSAFIQKESSNLKSELYIPKVVNDLVASGMASVKILPARDQWFGVTYREDKPRAIENISLLIRNGVYPDNLWG